MAERSRRPYDPYHDWSVGAGRENFNRLFLAEVRTMADNHSKDANYRLFRRFAVQFIESHYTVRHQFDALIPYMAMTFVDRFHLNGQIPTVVDAMDHNIVLFLTCCLIISWKLRTKRFVLENFLNEQQLSFFSVENVIDMESHICRKLEWRLRTVMPFWFIDFFVPFLNLPPKPSSALRLVYQLIVKAQFDIAFTEFRPSVIAASAMLIVTEKVFPNHVEAFQNYVINSEFLKPVKGQTPRCSRMLEKLYKGPSTADRGGASSSAAPRRSDSIPIPSPTGLEGKEPAASADEEPTHREGMHPSSDDEEPTNGEGKQPASDDEEPTHREGKEAAAGEIHPQQETGTGVRRHFPAEDNIDDLMNFKLGWIEAQGEVDNTKLAPGGGYFATFLPQRFCSCCDIL